MAGLTFREVMDYCKPHNQSVYDLIKKEQKDGRLRPFVGAGLSVFCGYQLWGGVLEKLASYIVDPDQRENAVKQIKNGEYEAAAQTIQENYPFMLVQLPGLISPEKIDDCPQQEFQASADFLLPRLFQKGLVITTNFDQVLETVYQKCNGTQLQRVLPKQTELLSQLRQKDALCLFKLHGDIGRDATTIDDLVFTGEQYKEKYEDGSPLVAELTRHYENCRLLFLGCSLYSDRTMEVLKQVTQKQKGLLHYAILNCAKSEIPKRMKELSEFGILPIFYDGKDHSAVRVILERLLEDTDQEEYKKLSRIAWASASASKEEHLMYDAEYFEFTGRKKELDALAAFCDQDDRISWWAVTGPGGMGKSRLVYEFAKQKQREGWCIERFGANQAKSRSTASLGDLAQFQPETAPSLVVLDDVQGHMEQVRAWLSKTAFLRRSEKLRILLLEREGKDVASASWLGSELCDEVPIDLCYSKEFLWLDAMTDEELRAVMENYAAVSGKQLNSELLLKTLERMDPELKRPLYAIAIADARCRGKDPTNWDQKKILDALLDRELSFHLNRLHEIIGKTPSKTMQTELQELLARSCIQGVLPLQVLDATKDCPKLGKVMENSDMGQEEFWECLGLLREVHVEKQGLDQNGKPVGEPIEEQWKAIVMTCPDLIKEHLVLKLVLEKNKQDLLFQEGWDQNPLRMLFVRKLLVDYSERLGAASGFWAEFLNATPNNDFTASIYADILWGYTSKYPDKASYAVDRLAKLYTERKRNPVIGIAYAHGLGNLSLNQNLKSCEETNIKLKELCKDHPDNADFALLYAVSLAGMSVKQDLIGRKETAAKLETIYENYPNNEEIAVWCAQGLVSLTFEQNLIGRKETVAKLKALCGKYPDNIEIAVAYAIGLVNSSYEQDLDGCEETVAKLKALCEDHPDNAEIVVSYAKGLGNLSEKQDLNGCGETADKLKELCKNHPNNAEIAVSYAKALLNLSKIRDLHGCAKTVDKLKALCEDYPDNAEIAVEYAGGLANLSFEQDLNGREETVAKLKALYEKHPDNATFAVGYAGGLASLSFEQDLNGREETAAKLKALCPKHPDIENVVVLYAHGLSSLTVKQNLNGCKETASKLKELSQTYSNNAGIAAQYASCLVQQSLLQNSASDVLETITRSKQILDRFPDHVDIQLAYSKTWFNLTLQQTDAEIPATVQDIAAFLRAHTGAIPGFKEALDKYLSDHPDHAARYQSLREL